MKLVCNGNEYFAPFVNGAFWLSNLTSNPSINLGAGAWSIYYEWQYVWYEIKTLNKDGGNYFVSGSSTVSQNHVNNNIQAGSFYLHPPTPNPVTHSTVLNFSLSQPGHAQLFVYDISGRLVKVLLDGERNAGPQVLTWDGTDSVGKPITNGVYTVMLSSQRGSLTKRVVVAR